ncbi:transmembrane protein 176B isoform X1 [Microcaecilia unicolor]|uniref:Transmembrane protein 176B-like isoform X1 n=1 Tax=Microcaecilia unicolor TaxID=1415580 RepID=A0A6P7ZKP4_9AMPH|nr:transmembrane protein 176B-like isoform X1 [Microcaecilia unicolor]XP_030077898.1 transmembrane protein 176B-like isoform X1 [Microcaecilia unicolor]
MPSVVIQTERMEPAQEGAEKVAVTVNVNICPSFSGLGNCITWLCTKMKPVGKIFRGEQTTCGAVQMVLGVLCIACGGSFATASDSNYYRNSHLVRRDFAFWTGGVFLVSGVVSIINEKFPTRCWILLALLMNLVSAGMAIAGINFCYKELRWSPANYDYVFYSCLRCNFTVSRWDPGYGKENKCQKSVQRLIDYLKTLFMSVTVLLLTTMIAELCITVYSGGYCLKSLCCKNSPEQDDKIAVESKNDSKEEPQDVMEICALTHMDTEASA